MKVKAHNLLGIFFTLLLVAGIMFGSGLMDDQGYPITYHDVLENGTAETGAENLVTAIYLDFRIFDTLFEALLLLVSVMGIKQFSGLSMRERSGPGKKDVSVDTRHLSSLPSNGLALLYPVIAVVGLYIIIGGADGPGGGFQGGAMLSAIYISIHFSTGRQLTSSHRLETIEKYSYVFILAVVSIFLMFHTGLDVRLHRLYLAVMNVLIGVKVFSGLSVIYYLFANESLEGGLGYEVERN